LDDPGLAGRILLKYKIKVKVTPTTGRKGPRGFRVG
jgi:hypothetical protein